MNKTVKHCSVCQENFGDRFSFCPVCGSQLASVAENADEMIAAAPRELPSNQAMPAVNYAAAPRENVFVKEVVSAPRVETNGNNYQTSNGTVPPRQVADKGLFNPTMLQTPKNYEQILLAGALAGLLFMMVGATTIYLYELFYYPLEVAAVDVNGDILAVYGDDEKPFKEEKEIERKDTRKGGGGGGGGGNESKPASKGGNPAMAPETPVFPPNVHRPSIDNASMPVQSTIQAPIRKAAEGPVGIKNSTNFDLSNGGGSGGGIGEGRGGGVGNGIDSGLGNGRGGGIGNGRGGGIGDGDGSGQNGDIPDFIKPVKKPDPPKPKVTEAYKIISQPKPNYTEEARKQNISGVVRVKVTLSASGQVTNISPVKGLGGGLTEMAIAAARRIQFTPAKVDGVPVSKTLTVEYNFTMY